jgi:LysR family transcriptional activator of nhaA
MEWLNYHHLFYFWNVVKEGTVTAAARVLHLARPTVTAQVRELEKAVGQKLFEKKGRRLQLTDFGQQVFEYADEMFTIGHELGEFIRTGHAGSRTKFVIGMPDVVPKLIAFELLKPALHLPERPHTVCYEGKLEELLADLALHRLDLVLSDSPAPSGVDVRVYSHKLGECGLSMLAVPKLAKKYRKGFPQSLDGAPVLFQTNQSVIRGALSRWLNERNIHPFVVAEFEDSGLLKVFGQSGEGIFPVPTAIENEVKKQYGVHLVGRLDEVKDKFYAISVEKRVQNPGVLAIVQQARNAIFD